MADDKKVLEGKAEDVLDESRVEHVLEESTAVKVLGEPRVETDGLRKLTNKPSFLERAKSSVGEFIEKNKDKKVTEVFEMARGGISTIFNKDKKPNDQTCNATTSEVLDNVAERSLDDGGAGGFWGTLAKLFEKCCSPNKKKD